MSGRTADRLTNLLSHYPGRPFEYDPELKMFAIGSDLVLLENYRAYRQPVSKPVSYDDAAALLEQSNLRLNVFGTHFQMPRLTRWLEGQNGKRLRQTIEYVTDAMIDAYAALGHTDKTELERTTDSTGFAMGLLRPGHPLFQVFGRCACYGVTPHGKVVGEREWQSGYAEYGDHNIEHPDQTIALHVGAGALAHLRKEAA